MLIGPTVKKLNIRLRRKEMSKDNHNEDNSEEIRKETFDKATEIAELLRENAPENYNVVLQEFIVQLLIESTDVCCYYELAGILEEAKLEFREFMREAMEDQLCDECKKKKEKAEENN